MDSKTSHLFTTELSVDYSPLRFDESFMPKIRFAHLMAQGGIVTGLLHALVAMDMQGTGFVFTKQSRTFRTPVYVGDMIRAEPTFLSVHPRRPMAEVPCNVTNQDGGEVLRGEATVFQVLPGGD